MKQEFVVIKQKDITSDYLDEIIRLKQQHWNYSYESQKEWIVSSLKDDDLHLLLKLDGVCVAYLSINIINMIVDEQKLIGKGLGNICVDLAYQKQGLGKKIVEKANEIIEQGNDIGILLCHAHLIPFYERCGWVNMKYDNLEIDNKVFADAMMFFNFYIKNISYMTLERNF